MQNASAINAPRLLDASDLDTLIKILSRSGYSVIGPTPRDGAVVYEPIQSSDGLAQGLVDDQDGGHYRLKPASAKSGLKDAYFAHVVGPHSWKRYLYPPVQTLWKAEKRGKGFSITTDESNPPKYALFGVRPCEIAALDIHDKVFDNDLFTDTGYRTKRDAAFVVAVNCIRAGGTCFCTSMKTGPRARGGFDLALTEIIGTKSHHFLMEIGSDRGAKIAAKLKTKPAKGKDIAKAEDVVAETAKSMGRKMIPDAAEVLKRNLEHPRWDDVAQRCLNCANCTMVCPTCFCSTVEDVTSLDGAKAERVRKWDSCFILDFSYIHGGSIRREGYSRYRQWITHKLSSWHEQFGTSGCTGCGRCITWCPVGIDITEEARAIRKSTQVQDGKQGGEK